MADPPERRASASPERWRRLQRLFREALDLAPEDRPDYLEEACPDDPGLGAEVEALLATHEALERSERKTAAAGPARTGPDSRGSGFPGPVNAARAAALLEAAGPNSLEADGEIGPYRLLRRLGRGGMGVVWLARDSRLDRYVALKLLPPWLALDEPSRRRLTEEAKAASALDHPNVETVYEIGETEDGRLYISMAYYEGETLEERIRRGPLPVGEAVDVATQVAEGLSATHRRGLVHRDIKPGNLIVTPEGLVKIVDFGVAKVGGRALTKAGATPGTVAYMSPEQTRGEEVDARSDLWSLGAVLYEMLTGRRPFRGSDDRVLIHGIRHEEPEPVEALRPEVPDELGAWVRRCLAKEPAERPPDAESLLRALHPLRGDVGPPERMARPSGGSRWLRRLARFPGTWAAAVAVLLIIGFGLLSTRPSTGDGEVVSGASAIAVIPPEPIGEDTALARLGRELAVTLSASLDGVGGIHVVPALTVLAQVGDAAYSLERGAELARRLGATSVVHGILIRSGDEVRLDFGLYGAEDLRPIARAAALAPRDHIAALSDSATLALLRGIWSRGEIPIPSLAAVTTGSVPALKAYLEGEQALARSDFRRAVAAFERAFEEDSTFWFAYWRSLHPRTYAGSRPDSAALAGLAAHRHEFPPADRLLVESHLAPSRDVRLAILRDVVRLFPDHWPGWWEYASELVRWGPYLGTSYPDARAAVEQVVTLNPSFAPGWEQLFSVAVFQRDTARARQALEELERAAAAGPRFAAGLLTFFRALEGLLRSGGAFPGDEAVRLARAALALDARGAPRPARVAVPSAEEIATSFLSYGFPRAQIQQADAILAEAGAREVAGAFWMGKALAWVARGAWDSTLAAADQALRLWDDPGAPLRAYGLAALGTALGTVEPEAALRWREAAARSPPATEPEGRAELAWLDGQVAHARGDVGAIRRAREEVRGSGSRFADLLGRSLEAYGLDAMGEREAAADSLAALEWESAEAGLHAAYGARHPYVPSIHRLSASRWLLTAGDTARATRLLAWHEALLWGGFDRVEAVSRAVEPLALLERARIEEAQGLVEQARKHYAGFLERYDAPAPAHGALVEQALQALRRLSAEGGG